MHVLHKFMVIHVLTCLGQNVLGSEIIHGKIVPENEMLYMASVQDSHIGHICGGFLVTEDFVMTAAHCDNGILRRVVLGNHNLKNGDNIERNIAMKCKHPHYKGVATGNDIMLLKLSTKVDLNESTRVKLIKLPSGEITLKEHEKCQVAGWGKTSTNSARVDDLRVVDVSVISQQVCKQQWKEWIQLPASVICAGGYGTTKGFCQGDSGGPLVCNGKAVGVVSFNRGTDCSYPDVPNVYADTSKYLNWINEILTKKTC